MSSYMAYVIHDVMDPIVTCHTYPGTSHLRSPSTPSEQRQELPLRPSTPDDRHILGSSSLYHDIETYILSIFTGCKPQSTQHLFCQTTHDCGTHHSSSKMAAKSFIPLLVGMMLLTGCCNTLFTKYQVHLPPPTSTSLSANP